MQNHGFQTEQEFEAWLEALPTSKMHYPDTVANKIKYFFWRLLTPIHPYVRDTFIALRIVKVNQFWDEKGRQKYLLGTIAPEHTIKDFISHLLTRGYANHFVAWRDRGEIASLRLAVGFLRQYHIRVFSDGEVRAHLEYTPEAHPFKHYYEIGMEPHFEYFAELFGDKIVPATSRVS